MGVFECFLQFFIIGSSVVLTVLQIVFYSVFSGKKKEVNKKKIKNKFSRWLHSLSNLNIASISNIGFHLILGIVYAIIPHCWLCIILLVLYFLWLIVITAVAFFRIQIINFLLKQAKKSKNKEKKAKMVQKLTNLKNKIEFNDAAVSLNDAFNIAPILDSDEPIDLIALYQKIEKTKGCEIKKDENVSGNQMITECNSFYATIKGNNGKIKKDRFAIIYDIRKVQNGRKGRAVVFLLKVEPKDRKAIFEGYSNSCVSKFPLGCDFIAFPLDDGISYVSCERLVDKAYKYSVKCLEEKEFDKMSKKLKV